MSLPLGIAHPCPYPFEHPAEIPFIRHLCIRLYWQGDDGGSVLNERNCYIVDVAAACAIYFEICWKNVADAIQDV